MTVGFDEGGQLALYAFIGKPPLGTPLASTDVTSWSIYVFEPSNSVTALYSLTGQTASAAFGSLQPWAQDDRGYNFAYTIPAGAFTSVGGKTYQVEIAVVTAAVGTIKAKAQAPCISYIQV